MLDARLAAAAFLVRPGCRMADIGTDHAYLPIHLVKQGISPAAIASDIRPGPAASAREHIACAGLSDRIDVRLADGLAGISPDEVDDIVIAGMGGETIAAILQAAPWVKYDRYRLILQPMTRPEELRRWLLTNGFDIDRERVVADGHHLYTVMAAAYADAPPVTDEAAYYRGALGRDGRPFLEKEIARLRQKAAGMTAAGQDTAAITTLINRLEDAL